MSTSVAKSGENGIKPDPFHPGPGEVRLASSWVPVWAVIGHLQATGGTVAQVAHDYGIEPDEVETAVSYYRRHAEDIDARLRANGDATTGSKTAVS